MIALGELFCLIVLAVTRAECWVNRLILYVTDNENTRIWLTKRRARNRLARYGLRLLQRLETKFHFQVVSGRVWTKHKLTMDLTTRATQQVIRDELHRQGLTEIDLTKGWHELLREIKGGSPLVLPGEDGDGATTARQLAQARRGAPAAPKPTMNLLLPLHFKVLEWRATAPRLALAWAELGATVFATPATTEGPCWPPGGPVTW